MPKRHQKNAIARQPNSVEEIRQIAVVASGMVRWARARWDCRSIGVNGLIGPGVSGAGKVA